MAVRLGPIILLLVLVTTTCADDSSEAVPSSTTTTVSPAPPTSTTAPTSTTSGSPTEPTAEDPTEPLGPGGIGAVRVGDTVTELTTRGLEITVADCEVPYVRFGQDGLIALRLAASETDVGETVIGMYVWIDERNDDIRTAEGIGRGSTRAEVLATYADRAVERTVETELGGADLRIDVADEASGNLMVFSFDEDDMLALIRVGEPSAIESPYLCA
ncbi:MAG: hypothetical protein DHS20C19_08470 [Acidimicrobiales bacterium]|nr:MAG: hypothetical protein DHS20C19_08470 [Acidimicrobiales bacterium]